MYYPSKLLTRNNHKTIKGEKFGYITYILYLSPYKDNSKGINLCPHASAGCAAACLFKSGMAGMYINVANGRRNKTEFFLEDKPKFMAQLEREISLAILRHPNDKVVFRLNGTSDIMWERIKIGSYKNLFERFPKVQFYDYTKNDRRMSLNIPNYHVTFSRNEVNGQDALKVLAMGHNVAVVFKDVPKVYRGYKVINGDLSDLRFKDRKGVVVGLKYKNATGKSGKEANEASRTSGFVIM